MSEPPPGAVLITNSTGLVGFVMVAAVAAAPPLGLAVVGAAPPPQATRVMRAVARNAVVARFLMRCTSIEQLRPVVSKGSHRGLDGGNRGTMRDSKSARWGFRSRPRPPAPDVQRRLAWCRS